jgi:hypothetical protein
LQQKLYKDRNYGKDQFNDEFVYEYVSKMRLEDNENYLPNDELSDNSSLRAIINQDKNLKYIYDDNSFYLKVD